MNYSNQRPPYASIFFLLLVGIGAAIFAFWLLDHRQAVPNSGAVIAVLVFVFFVAFTWAFVRYLRWKDQTQATVTSGSLQPDPNLKGTVYGILPGREYQVVKSFTDHYGNVFERGERLRFKQRHFLPYHGGHTIVFDGRTLYLQEDQDREILDHFSEYIALIEP